MTTLTVFSAACDDRWHVASGLHNKRYPWWVTRIREGKREYARNRSDNLRGFATMEAAQKVADKLQITADFDDSREHARLAVHHMLRATNHLQPDHPIMATLNRMADIYLELTGEQL